MSEISYRTITHNRLILKLVKLLSKNAGRDKLFRIIQYLSKFLSFYYKTESFNNLANLFGSITKELSLIRKSLRFLKPLDHIVNIGKIFDLSNKSNNFETFIKSAKEFSLITYLIFDQIILFKDLKILTNKNFVPNSSILASKFWALSISFGLVNDVYTLNKNKKQGKDQYLTQRRFLWDCLDLTVALNASKFLNNDQRLVALAGIVTSVFGFQDVWKSIQ